MTNNLSALNIISGYDFEFSAEYESVMSNMKPAVNCFDNATSRKLTVQIAELLSMGVIEKCTHSVGEYISSIFLVDKRDGEFRKILNLKRFNQAVEYQHFKMENLKTLCDLMSENCYMTSIDLRKAYYSVSISKDSRKYLRFEWKGQLYQYCSLPNGLASGPRIFSKIMRVLFTNLRQNSIDCVYYLDDSVIFANSADECLRHTNYALDLLTKAGFFIHFGKSVLQPSHRLTFLGFVVDSTSMMIFLPNVKVEKLRSCAEELIHIQTLTIERLAQVIGFLVSCLPAFPFGKLHYRSLEFLKIEGLRSGSYHSKVTLSETAKSDLQWWQCNAHKSGCPIRALEYSTELRTDASLRGYGAFFNGQSIGSRWTSDELMKYGHSINCLELHAVYLAINAFSKSLVRLNVCIRVDNTTAVSYINAMGGTHSVLCNEIAISIWNLALSLQLGIHATHIPGVENIEADHASRFFRDDVEIMLNCCIFKSICSDLDLYPTVDLFATRHNRQLPIFVSWKPDPESSYIDALSLDWTMFTSVYIFPPFSLWGRLLKRLKQYQSTVQMLLVFPKWESQHWYPQLTRMLKKSIQLPSNSVVCHNRKPHRLNLTLMAGKI